MYLRSIFSFMKGPAFVSEENPPAVPSPEASTTQQAPNPTEKEPVNPFYWMLLLGGVAFVITVMAVTFVPILEEKARNAGREVPQSDFRNALRKDGYWWVLYEVAFIVVTGLASMGLDRLRRLQKERSSGKIPSSQQQSVPAEHSLDAGVSSISSGPSISQREPLHTGETKEEPEQRG